MISITDAIARAYHDDENGFGSMANTLKHAKEINPDVKFDDIRKWMSLHIGDKKQLKGYNSFVADGPYIEYQIDLLFF